MKAFAALIDRLAFEPSRLGKIALMRAYFSTTPDPERGLALAAITGGLTFPHAKPALIRTLMAERTDPALFALCYDYVGDLSETVALLWPAPPRTAPAPTLSEVVAGLAVTGRAAMPARIVAWLDALDETGRWAFLKLITGSLRIGVSARLAKTAVAELGGREPNDIEQVWHGLRPPYLDLFAWIDGRGPRPETENLAPFRPPMLAHGIEDRDFDVLLPTDFLAEWKWDGIRVQAARGFSDTQDVTQLYSRSGEDLSLAFPDLVDALAAGQPEQFAIDGELLILRESRVQSFGVLQQRLNRKAASAKLLVDFPAHVRVYDLLAEDGTDLRDLTFEARRERLEAWMVKRARPRLDLSPLIVFDSWERLAAHRRAPQDEDAGAIEGVMLKRRTSPYVPGRPKGLWYKWKRDPFNVDAVLMYAQRGHGKRSSFYSDFTFGVWKEGELVPVGKAYFGFTDAELLKLDKFVREKTVNRFGPVREVAHEKDRGLVLEIAFEGLNRSTRHKSGVAMRFPRIARIRWDKSPGDADGIEALEAMLA